MLKVITPPSEIITVEEAADFMRIDFPDDEESTIEMMITAARQWCEEYLGRAIGVQTLELTLDQFPHLGKKAIFLRPPLISITSFTYLDSDAEEQSLVVDEDYFLAADAEPAQVRPYSCWPTTLNTADAVRIRFQTGYYPGGSPALSIELPRTIKQAILMQASDLYHNREAQVERPLTVNLTLERLLSMYRLEMGL